jgi:hypothetical protein
MKHINVYKVVSEATMHKGRRDSDASYMAKHGITLDKYQEFDWGFTDGTYSAVTTEWRKR